MAALLTSFITCCARGVATFCFASSRFCSKSLARFYSCSRLAMRVAYLEMRLAKLVLSSRFSTITFPSLASASSPSCCRTLFSRSSTCISSSAFCISRSLMRSASWPWSDPAAPSALSRAPYRLASNISPFRFASLNSSSCLTSSRFSAFTVSSCYLASCKLGLLFAPSSSSFSYFSGAVAFYCLWDSTSASFS